jgi:hypothetical protein
MLKASGIKRLKLKYDNLLSNFAFEFNLRHYILEDAEPVARMAHPESLNLNTAGEVQGQTGGGWLNSLTTATGFASWAGAYTRSQFGSNSAVSDTQRHLSHLKHPLTPP